MSDNTDVDLTIDFVGRASDFVERMYASAEVTESIEGTQPEDTAKIRNTVSYISRFLEGTTTYQIFTPDAMSRLMNEIVGSQTLDFILALQQYTMLPYTASEIHYVASQMATAIAPAKVMLVTDDDVEISAEPSSDSSDADAGIYMAVGAPELQNSPADIMRYFTRNLWVLPLVALSFSESLRLITMSRGISDGV